MASFIPPMPELTLGVDLATSSEPGTTSLWSGSIGKKTTKRKSKKIEGVAETVAHFAKEKAKFIGEKLKIKKEEEEQMVKTMEEKAKKLRIVTQNKTNLEEKFNILTQTKRAELVASYRRVITKLKKYPLIDKFSVDSYKRVIITTTPLTVVKDGWDKPKEIGRYQIRIDFSENSYHEAIQILNIDQRFGDYDSPTILRTKPCWGNIGQDIENEFSSQDLYELIIDLIDYIKSPETRAGYLGKDGDKELGWEQFLENAKKTKKGYNFEKHDQLNKLDRISGVPEELARQMQDLVVSDGSTATSTSEYLTYDESSVGLINSQSSAMSTEEIRRYYGGATSSSLDQEVDRDFLEVLYRVGLKSRAAYYFLDLIKQEMSGLPQTGERGSDWKAVDIEIRSRGDHQFMIYVSFELRNGIPMMMTERADSVMDQGRIVSRFFANEQDFERGMISRLLTRGNIFRITCEYPTFGRSRARDRISEQSMTAENVLRGLQQVESQQEYSRRLTEQQS